MKVFNKDFTVEDVVLYIFGVSVMVIVGLFLVQAQEQLEIKIVHDGAAVNEAGGIDGNIRITQLKYKFASKILLSNSTRKNIAFLVGTLLAILGCMIIIRGVRDSPFEGEVNAFERAKVKIKASSPGIVVVLCGTLILILSVVIKDEYTSYDPIMGGTGGIKGKATTGGEQHVTLTDEEKKRLTRKSGT